VQDRVGVAVDRRERTQRARNRQNSQEPSRLHSFRSFGISPAFLAILSSLSITTPTEIQAACIPQTLAGECVSSLDSREVEERARQGLYWKRQDGFWEDDRVRIAHFAEVVTRPVWAICAHPHTYEVILASLPPFLCRH
jgi:hypothetical protein